MSVSCGAIRQFYDIVIVIIICGHLNTVREKSFNSYSRGRTALCCALEYSIILIIIHAAISPLNHIGIDTTYKVYVLHMICFSNLYVSTFLTIPIFGSKSLYPNTRAYNSLNLEVVTFTYFIRFCYNVKQYVVLYA